MGYGGLAIAPQTPYRRNNKRGLSLHQKPWVTKAGGQEYGHQAPSLTLLGGAASINDRLRTAIYTQP